MEDCLYPDEDRELKELFEVQQEDATMAFYMCSLISNLKTIEPTPGKLWITHSFIYFYAARDKDPIKIWVPLQEVATMEKQGVFGSSRSIVVKTSTQSKFIFGQFLVPRDEVHEHIQKLWKTYVVMHPTANRSKLASKSLDLDLERRVRSPSATKQPDFVEQELPPDPVPSSAPSDSNDAEERLASLSSENDLMKKKIVILTSNLDNMRIELHRIQQERNAMRKDIDAKNDMMDKYQLEWNQMEDDMQKKISKLNSEISKLQSELSERDGKLKRLQLEFEEMKSELEISRKSQLEFQESSEERQRVIDHLNEDFQIKEEKFLKKIQILQDEIQDGRNLWTEREKEVNDSLFKLKTHLEESNAQIGKYQVDLEQTKQERNNFRVENDSLKKEMEQLRNKLNRNLKENSSLQDEFSTFKLKYESELSEAVQVRSQLESTRDQLETAAKEIKILGVVISQLERDKEGHNAEKVQLESKLREYRSKYEYDSDEDGKDEVELKKHGNWMSDEHVKYCPLCTKDFNALRRKHHCRRCGRIFCNECSSQKLILPELNSKKPKRVCTVCFQQLKAVMRDHRT
eukprot:TRINITY_DN2824_c2_g1_i1.p1 TRINITY_DN2824_c2_g1~~TRINITY_DN2824_c2_g1_i1.p1  ORF type:complete len:574 (-),score=219.75 TRINITY_DN2824_c2_g1_i1:123-1844(-)